MYNSSIVTTAIATHGPWISSLVLNFLKDTSVSIQTDPISNRCKAAGSSCSSFLIPGGLKNVTPWPFKKTNDSSLAYYITRGTPAYQIDFWPVPTSFHWPPFSECPVYGTDENSGFQLCLSYDEDLGETIAGNFTGEAFRYLLHLY